MPSERTAAAARRIAACASAEVAGIDSDSLICPTAPENLPQARGCKAMQTRQNAAQNAAVDWRGCAPKLRPVRIQHFPRDLMAENPQKPGRMRARFLPI